MHVTFLHLGRESLGIEYLSAVLKQHGHTTSLALDPGLFGENDNVLYVPLLERFFDQRGRLLRQVKEEQPDIVGFSAYTNTYRWCCDVAREVRKICDARVVFGGIHATLVPDVVVQEDCVDYVVVGEAEEAMAELADALAAGEPTDHIRNVWTETDGRVHANPIRPPIEDVDALPFPDKALFEKDINYEDDYLLLASRGCVFSCSYCCESAINRMYRDACGKRFYRRRSVGSVMAELREMYARYGFREVMFNDAIFFTDKQWLRELLAAFKTEIGVKFRCFGQVRFMDEEVARLLRWAGCYAIEFGVQTMNESIRQHVLNRHESNEHNRRAFEICDRFGLQYDIDHMFGLPGESEADHVSAARFYAGLKELNRLKCHNLTWFPRTPIAELGQERGLLSPEEVAAGERGDVGDFFHVDSVKAREQQETNRGFWVLYRFLPLLRPQWVGHVLRRKWRCLLGRLPSPLVILGQVLLAIRNRDYRYLLYVKYYGRRLSRWFSTRR